MQLRTAVFVHEQGIVEEAELDGRDLDPTTTLYWCEEADGTVLATLRVLRDEPTPHIGRVATAADARGRGLARDLVLAALADSTGPVEISAQAYLENWYAALGFVTTGPGYVEAGIDHVPMRWTPPGDREANGPDLR
ncbi:GNAT family N-acetyltransferase [Rhodococcus gannanensis]|uniref:GNAT family N-acetyltransferase n=1 Tax=Rhodococcus gannanensis TaxID=1960308 RepID=A0ABW4P4M8_9NOCA